MNALVKPGSVALVGAGPGDPELLTLKAARAIAEADVILVDDLVNPALLSHARATARVVYVGKRGGCASTPQAFIGKLLVREAQAGHRVVRLKGGDPSVFGRAAEELADCDAAGIGATIIPGITAASAAAAQARAPLTDRAAGRGVAFITGHSQDGAEETQWAALVATGLTLVIYMGVGRCASIADALRKGGAKPTLPCVIVEHASTPNARTIATTLMALRNVIEREAVQSPAVLMIGEAMRTVQAETGRAIAVGEA
jgi:uroporphyrin-III C-methyltransferase